MQIFNDVVVSTQSLEWTQVKTILLDALHNDQSEAQIETINRYATYFFAEFKHFLTMHGFIKSEPSNNPTNEPKTVIQQNNFFSVPAPE